MGQATGFVGGGIAARAMRIAGGLSVGGELRGLVRLVQGRAPGGATRVRWRWEVTIGSLQELLESPGATAAPL